MSKKKKNWSKRKIGSNLNCIPARSASAGLKPSRVCVDTISHTSQNLHCSFQKDTNMQAEFSYIQDIYTVYAVTITKKHHFNFNFWITEAALSLIFTVCTCAELTVIHQNNVWVLKPSLPSMTWKTTNSEITVALGLQMDRYGGQLFPISSSWRLAAEFPWNWKRCRSGHEGRTVGWKIRRLLYKDGWSHYNTTGGVCNWVQMETLPNRW